MQKLPAKRSLHTTSNEEIEKRRRLSAGSTLNSSHVQVKLNKPPVRTMGTAAFRARVRK